MEVPAIKHHAVSQTQRPQSSYNLHNIFPDSVHHVTTSRDNKPTSWNRHCGGSDT